MSDRPQLTFRPTCAPFASVTAQARSSSIEVKRPELTTTRYESREDDTNIGHLVEDQKQAAEQSSYYCNKDDEDVAVPKEVREQETDVLCVDEDQHDYATDEPQETEIHQENALPQLDNDIERNWILELHDAEKLQEHAEDFAD